MRLRAEFVRCDGHVVEDAAMSDPGLIQLSGNG